MIHQLATCAWVKAGHPLCFIGDSGTGKSHLLIGLGIAAVEVGYRVRYALASKLVNELAEAADDRQLSRTIASNELFSAWTETFTDPRLCAAIVDRLTFAGQIIETGTTSYRLAHARAVKRGKLAHQGPAPVARP
jgi:DNA replication protein DnaC